MGSRMNTDKLAGLSHAVKASIEHFIECWGQDSVLPDIPHYLNFQPIRLKRNLSHTAIMEMDAAGGIFYRLCGSSIENCFGRYMTNAQISDQYANFNEAEAINELYSQSIIQECGMIRFSQKRFAKKLSAIPFVTLSLPMEHHKVLGGNLLMSISFFSETMSDKNNALINTMDRTDKVTDIWEDIFILEMNNKFNPDLLSQSVKDFIVDRNISIKTLTINDFCNMVATEDMDQSQKKIVEKTLEKSLN